ncbi:MAG: hypothetical protein IJJ80_06375 [Clostridia bacterium]|nr:hypothetical protein [Clostridia bacterium]
MKKLFALVLVLALAMSAVAFAEEAPAEAIGSPVPMEITYFTPEGIKPAVKSAEEDTTVGQLLEAIKASDVETVFASAGAEDIANYELVELVGLTIDEYNAETMDEVVLNIRFASAFTSDMKLLTLLGLIDGTEVTWQNLDFQVEENGTLTITFTAEQAEAVANGTAVIAVLKAKAE